MKRPLQIISTRGKQRKPFDFTPELESWLLKAADKPTTPLTKADFNAIRERARTRNWMANSNF